MGAMHLRLEKVRILLIFTVAACGDNLGTGRDGGPGGGGGNDAGGPADAGLDAGIECPQPAAAAPGAACAANEDCDSTEGAGDGRCLGTDNPFRGFDWPEAGFCARICEADADDCGAGTSCVEQEGATNALCLPVCCEGVACWDGAACSSRLLGVDAVDTSVCVPGSQPATDGDACATFGDCDQNSQCAPDQSGTSGTCTTVGCAEGDDSTCAPGGDGTCVDFDADGDEPPRCLDPCEEEVDCDPAQRCDETGDADVEGTYCRHAEVGDTCEEGTCGDAPWSCVLMDGADEWPDGYCTIPCGDGCPDGTVCNDKLIDDGTEPFCVEGCTILDGCPREPDYECQDVNAAPGGGGITLGCAPSVL
jgi:hypothetical protein